MEAKNYQDWDKDYFFLEAVPIVPDNTVNQKEGNIYNRRITNKKFPFYITAVRLNNSLDSLTF